MRGPQWMVAAGLAVAVSCGGSEQAAPAAVPPTSAESTAVAPRDTAGPDTTASQRLMREVFAYRSGGRDPFTSLLLSGDVRPLLEDLRLTTVLYDPRYPARSVAVLRDVSVNKRYDVRVDDELGRMRVVAIRPFEVVLQVEEFGAQRQVTLALPKREGVP